MEKVNERNKKDVAIEMEVGVWLSCYRIELPFKGIVRGGLVHVFFSNKHNLTCMCFVEDLTSQSPRTICSVLCSGHHDTTPV